MKMITRIFTMSLFFMSLKVFAQSSIGLRDVLALPLALESVTNVSRLESNVRQFYNNSKNTFPKQGILSEINETFILSYYSYTGEFCSLMIDRDMKKSPGQRWLHNSVDFNIPVHNWSDANLQILLDNYAEVIWQRKLDSDEYNVLLNGFKDLLKDLPQTVSSNEIFLLSLCSTYLASPGFLFIGGK